MDLPICVEKHNTNRKALKKGKTETKLALAQQTLAEIALRPKLDCRKLGGDAETLDAGLKGLSPKLWSLHPIVVYNREPTLSRALAVNVRKPSGFSRDRQRPPRDRARDCRKIRRDAETVDMGLKERTPNPWSLRLCVFYDGLWTGLWVVSGSLLENIKRFLEFPHLSYSPV